jgi:hypothetical protein
MNGCFGDLWLSTVLHPWNNNLRLVSPEVLLPSDNGRGNPWAPKYEKRRTWLAALLDTVDTSSRCWRCLESSIVAHRWRLQRQLDLPCGHYRHSTLYVQNGYIHRCSMSLDWGLHAAFPHIIFPVKSHPVSWVLSLITATFACFVFLVGFTTVIQNSFFDELDNLVKLPHHFVVVLLLNVLLKKATTFDSVWRKQVDFRW